MSRRRQLRNVRRNILLGAFLLVCLFGLTILTQRLGPFTLEERTEWPVYFGERSLIEEGSAVFTSGIKVGLVKSVGRVSDRELAPGRYVKAVLTVDRDLTLWEGARVVLASRSLLGRSAVEIDRGDPSRKRLAPGTPLEGSMERGLVDELSTVVKENRENIATTTDRLADIADRIARGEGTLGRILADDELYRTFQSVGQRLDTLLADVQSPESSLGLALRERELYDELTGAVRSIRGIADGIRAGKGPAGRLVADEDLARRLDETITSVRNLVQRVERGEGTLGLLLTDDTLHRDLVGGVGALRRFAERIEGGEGTLSKLVEDDEVYENLRVLSANLRLVSEDVRAGKGTLGLLLKDEGVYRELERMLESFRESGDIARENAPLSSLTSFTSLFFNVLN